MDAADDLDGAAEPSTNPVAALEARQWRRHASVGAKISAHLRAASMLQGNPLSLHHLSGEPGRQRSPIASGPGPRSLPVPAENVEGEADRPRQAAGEQLSIPAGPGAIAVTGKSPIGWLSAGNSSYIVE